MIARVTLGVIPDTVPGMTVFTDDEREQLESLFNDDETYTATGDPASALMRVLVECGNCNCRCGGDCDCACDGGRDCDCECHA